jgi:hypothetical protein
MDPNISCCGTLNEWFHLAKDEPEWNDQLAGLEPKQSDSPTSSTLELSNDPDPPSRTACDITGIPDFPSQLKPDPWNGNH